jgi:hypothetical protein
MRHSDTAAEGAVLGRDLSGNSIYQAGGIRSPLPEQFAGTFVQAGPSRVLRVLPVGCEPSLSYTPALFSANLISITQNYPHVSTSISLLSEF